jgi:hypothetical protein
MNMLGCLFFIVSIVSIPTGFLMNWGWVMLVMADLHGFFYEPVEDGGVVATERGGFGSKSREG